MVTNATPKKKNRDRYGGNLLFTTEKTSTQVRIVSIVVFQMFWWFWVVVIVINTYNNYSFDYTPKCKVTPSQIFTLIRSEFYVCFKRCASMRPFICGVIRVSTMNIERIGAKTNLCSFINISTSDVVISDMPDDTPHHQAFHMRGHIWPYYQK